MTRTARRLSRASVALLSVAAASAVAGLSFVGGCTTTTPPPPPTVKYAEIPPPAGMPAFMAGSVYERSIALNTDPHRVSNWGLVGQLRGTGDTTASNAVRGYMLKEMVRRGFGDALIRGYEKVTASDILKSPNYAIVRVDAEIPPGARKDDWIDATISCLDGNETSSLAHGRLFETDLTDNGADTDRPGGAVNVRVVVKGPVMVRPAYALENPTGATPEVRQSLRTGSVLGNAKVKQDRPIMLQVRAPSAATVRRIEDVVRRRFQENGVAQALDEGIVNIHPPLSFRGDWKHFVNVVQHLYLTNDPAFNINKAKELAAEAVKPGAKLEDISYAWEGIGAVSAMDFVRPLLNHPDQQVAFYAARAAAFMGDPTQAAENRLMQMARSVDHPHRLAAVRTLGQLPPSASLNGLLRELLDSEMTLIRVQAYEILAKYKDPAGGTDGWINRTIITPPDNPNDEKFVLDVVAGRGVAPPLVYVTQGGVPRVAVIGRVPIVDADSPMTLMDNRLTIAGQDKGRAVLMFFRDPMRDKPVQVLSQPTLDKFVARLGGRGGERSDVLDFTYGEVVAILQKLIDNNRLSATDLDGKTQVASMVVQEPGRLADDLANAPMIANTGGITPTGIRPPTPDRIGPAGPVPLGSPTSPAGVPTIGPAGAEAGTSNAPKF